MSGIMQQGIYECPVCGGPMSSHDYDAYGTCCERETPCDEFQEQLEVERMEDEGGLVAGEVLEPS